MKIKSFTQGNNYEIIKKKDLNDRDIRLYNYKNVQFIGLSNHYPDILFKFTNLDYLMLPLKEMTMSLGKQSFYEENGMNFDYSIEEKISDLNIVTNNVFYFIYNFENYYHFIYDTLPYLFCFLKLKEKGFKIKLLINYPKKKDKLFKFVEESLQILGLSQDIIVHQKNNYYQNLYLSSSLTHNGLSNNPPRKEIFEIYNLMIKNAFKIYQQPHHPLSIKKIYISRRTWSNKSNISNIGTNYTNRRKLMNEDNLVKNLTKLEYQEIFGENYSMIEKIILFNNAECVIGAIGGTITNCIFCNKKCRIIVLVNPDFLNLNKRMKFLLPNSSILFTNTFLDCKPDQIPIHVRVEITDKNSIYFGKLAEIKEYLGKNSYLLQLSDNYIGWNNEQEYQIIIMQDNQFFKLDNGINSPWKVNTSKLLDLLDVLQ
jgi:capsular polysaccharide biosynthesis protein